MDNHILHRPYVKQKIALMLMIVAIALLVIPTISAMDWDNWLNYEDKNGIEDKVVEITNREPFGVYIPFVTETIGEAELMTPQMHSVPIGDNVQVIKIDTTEFTDECDINGVEFINMKTGESENKNYHWEIAIYEDLTLPDTEYVCTITQKGKVLQNGTVIDVQSCERKVIGTITT